MGVFHEQLKIFLDIELEQGCRFMVSANDPKSIAYFTDNNYRLSILPAGQEKEYIKKYAALLFVAVRRPNKAIIDWISNCPMYGPDAPVCLVMAQGDGMFTVTNNTRVYEY